LAMVKTVGPAAPCGPITTGLLQIAVRAMQMVPLSLRERAGVRGYWKMHVIWRPTFLQILPHPNPLPEGEGTAKRRFCKTPITTLRRLNRRVEAR